MIIINYLISIIQQAINTQSLVKGPYQVGPFLGKD